MYVEDEKYNNHQLSRKIKMLGTDYINNNYDISVWQDASVIWDKKPSLFVKEYLKNNSFASFKHAFRKCIYEEAAEIIRSRKESKEVAIKHMKFLRKEKFPENMGLYEMTIFVKKHNDPKVKETMELWFKTYLEHSKRDQLSFMYSVWKTGLKIDDINLNVWSNEWVHHATHNYKKKLVDCRIYYGDSTIEELYNYNLDYVYKYKIKDNIYSVTATVPLDTKIIEIDITDVPCMVYSDFEISLPCKEEYFFNTIEYKDKNIFYNYKGIVRLEGNFKKGEKLHFSIKLEYLSDNEKLEFINELSNNVIILSEDNENMKFEMNRYEKVQKSIFYRFYRRSEKIKRFFRKK